MPEKRPDRLQVVGRVRGVVLADPKVEEVLTKDKSSTFERVQLTARVSMNDHGVVIDGKVVQFDNYTFEAMRGAKELKKGDLFLADIGVQPGKCGKCGNRVRSGFFEIQKMFQVADMEAQIASAKELKKEA